MLVVEVANGTYSSVLLEGPVTMRPLGDETEPAMLAMASRYMGPARGKVYTNNFMAKLATNDFPDGHGDTEIVSEANTEQINTD